jgi:hypothetical protein
MQIHKLKCSPKQNSLLLISMLVKHWNSVSHRHIICLHLMHCYNTHMAITIFYNQIKKKKNNQFTIFMYKVDNHNQIMMWDSHKT